MRIWLATTIIFLCAFAKAQPALDTIAQALKAKPKFFLKFDTRNSFIANSRAQIAGLKAGISYGKKLYFGAGYHQMYNASPAFHRIENVYAEGNLYQVIAKMNLSYISLSAEYVFYEKQQWKLSMPVQIGVGRTSYRYKFNNKNVRVAENTGFIYEPGVSIEYKIISWIGAGADIGYRFMINADKRVTSAFTSPTYAFKAILYYSELYRLLFPGRQK